MNDVFYDDVMHLSSSKHYYYVINVVAGSDVKYGYPSYSLVRDM
jgi:hypothetical protein